MLSLTASTSCAPSGTCSTHSVTARRTSGALIASNATLLGAERLGHPQIALPSRDSLKTVVIADHPIPSAIRADLTACEALAELTISG
jgi:hypothetical protein